jgi:pimeloyl-ACP methyl ester carboxylesterase
MTQDTVEAFLTATTEDRLRMVQDDNNAEPLETYLGQNAYNEYRKLAEGLDENHLGIDTPKNLIFVPGIMGSMLQSRTLGGIWWVDVRTLNHIDHLKLSPNGLADANANYQIVPCCVDTSYEPFQSAIINRNDFGHIAFPYDWRKPFVSNTSALKDLIFELYDSNGNEPVHLVAHSMGGLLVRATLMDYGQELWPKIGRIAFIATPHYGSPAIAGYLKNHFWGFRLMALLGKYLSRDTYRSLWGALSMMPAPRGVYPGTRPNDPIPWESTNVNDLYEHPCANFDMYQAGSWKLDLSPQQSSELQHILSEVVKFHSRMFHAHQELDQELRDRMVVIAGVGFRTLFRLASEPRFFGRWERMVKVFDRILGDPHRDGDGRVPLASAALEDVAIRYARAVHGGLPNIPDVYNDVFRWLNEESMNLPETVEEALSQHLAPETESEAPHLDGTAIKISADDPGYWDLTEPDQTQLDELQSKLEHDHLPEFARVRML